MSHARFARLGDFFSILMVSQRAGIGGIVKQNRAVGGNEGDAVLAGECLEVRWADPLNGVGDVVGLDGQLVKRLRLIFGEHHAEKQHAAGQKHADADKKSVSENLKSHTPPPIL